LPPKEGETGESPATATNPKAESNPAAPAKASAGGSPGGISPENGAAVTSGATATNGKSKYDAAMLERAGAAFVELAVGGEGDQSRSEQFARFQSDAPPCDNCGSITVRNGNCYLCHNCGNSMGCS
jgi:ribonucleoside-diphosphate reductase alpha chain